MIMMVISYPHFHVSHFIFFSLEGPFFAGKEIVSRMRRITMRSVDELMNEYRRIHQDTIKKNHINLRPSWLDSYKNTSDDTPKYNESSSS